MAKVYKSKLDWWLAAILPLPMVGGAAALVAGLVRGEAVMTGIGAAALLLYLLILAGLVLPLRYTIGDDRLEVRAGLQRLAIPWERLIAARPSSNPISSPALSLRRLAIEYRKPNGRAASVLISPTDRAQFVRDLAAASPRHRLDGDALVEKLPG